MDRDFSRAYPGLRWRTRWPAVTAPWIVTAPSLGRRPQVRPPLDPDALSRALRPAPRSRPSDHPRPLVVHAGAGSGKTRVVTHRVAYAVATAPSTGDACRRHRSTDKAAAEMAGRLADLASRAFSARTFHRRRPWPSSATSGLAPRRRGRRPRARLEDPLVGRLARDLPGGLSLHAAKDSPTRSSGAKSRRLSPRRTPRGRSDRDAADPVELFVACGPVRAGKDRAGRLDFDDMLTRTVELLETDERPLRGARPVRLVQRGRVPDTNPLQQRLRAVARRPRRPLRRRRRDQTIYTFAGATRRSSPASRTVPGAREVTLRTATTGAARRSSRSPIASCGGGSPEAAGGNPAAGPRPSIRRCADGEAEPRLVVTSSIR